MAVSTELLTSSNVSHSSVSPLVLRHRPCLWAVEQLIIVWYSCFWFGVLHWSRSILPSISPLWSGSLGGLLLLSSSAWHFGLGITYLDRGGDCWFVCSAWSGEPVLQFGRTVFHDFKVRIIGLLVCYNGITSLSESATVLSWILGFPEWLKGLVDSGGKL